MQITLIAIIVCHYCIQVAISIHQTEQQNLQQQEDAQLIVTNNNTNTNKLKFFEDNQQENQEQQTEMKILKLQNSQDEIIYSSDGKAYLKRFDHKTGSSMIIDLNDINDIDYTNREIYLDNNQKKKQYEGQFIPQTYDAYLWTPIFVLNQHFPNIRGGHTMNILGDYIIIFGGSNLDKQTFNDLFLFNIRQKEWIQPKIIGQPPSPRNGHSSTLVGSHLYIFGGSTVNGLKNDLHVLDLETRSWEEKQLEGIKPTPRSNHQAVLDNNGRIVIFGGYIENSFSNEIFFLNLVQLRWEKPQFDGAPAPLPRTNFCMNLIRNNIIWIFGGYAMGSAKNDIYELNLNTYKWQKFTTYNLPSERQGMSCIKHNKELFLIGGCNYQKKECYDDIYQLNIDSLYWTKLDQRGSNNIFTQREEFGAIVAGSLLYIFGGCNLSNNCNNDFFLMNITQACGTNCSNNGVCRNERCMCKNGYQEEDCSIQLKCQNDCTNQGFCQSNGKCQCYPGYAGQLCDIYVLCPMNCTSEKRGICQHNGVCKCNETLYKGEACQIKVDHKELQCQNNCTNRGACNLKTGICICQEGYGGSDCSIDEQTEIMRKKFDQEQQIQKLQDLQDGENGEDGEIELSSQENLNINQTQIQNETNQSNNQSIIQQENNNITQNQTNNGNQTQFIQKSKKRLQQSLVPIELLQQQQDKTQIQDLSECKDFNECSQHGICVNLQCYCSQGYMGQDCSAKTLKDLKTGEKPIYLLYWGTGSLILGLIIGYKLLQIYYEKQLDKEFNDIESYKDSQDEEQDKKDDEEKDQQEDKDQDNQNLINNEDDEDNDDNLIDEDEIQNTKEAVLKQ